MQELLHPCAAARERCLFLEILLRQSQGPFRWSFADLPCQAILVQKFRVLWFGKLFLVAKYSRLRWIWSGIQELNFRYNPLAAENVEFEGCVLSCCVSRSKHKPWNFSIYWTPMRKSRGKLHWDQKGFARSTCGAIGAAIVSIDLLPVMCCNFWRVLQSVSRCHPDVS